MSSHPTVEPGASAVTHAHGRPRQIELRLRDLSQLFNSMDPSPFHEKDLDHDAEEFIVSWAEEFHHHEPLHLVIHLQQVRDLKTDEELARQAIHHYFEYRTRMNDLEFRRLMKQGRASLLVGLPFLAACLAATDIVGRRTHPLTTWDNILQTSLTVAGWVAMSRPLEIYLYEWWPLRRKGKIYRRLSSMPVQVIPDVTHRTEGPVPIPAVPTP